MTELDAMILTLSAVLAAFSVATGRGVGLAFIVFLSFTINEWAISTLSIESYPAFFKTGARWMAMTAAIDLFVIAFLSYRANRSEVMMILVFGVSCIFHLLCRIEFIGADIDAMPLYDIRFNFVQIIAALQLTGVIINFTGGSGRGGKLARLRFNRLNFYNHRGSSQKAFKVKS